MTHITRVVLAQQLYPEKLPGDVPEELEVVPWPIDDLLSITARDDCTEGRTIAALHRPRLARGRKDAVNGRAVERLAHEVESIARRAGEAILGIYAQEFDVAHKADASPLTAADLASHHLIRD